MKNITYILILIISCTDSNLVPDKDCTGTIGGNAVIDDCGYCTGGSTNMIFNQMFGCDSTCRGSKFDINDKCCPQYEWDCDGLCDGTASLDCNSTCKGNGDSFFGGVHYDFDLDGILDSNEYYMDYNFIKVEDSLFLESSDTVCCFIDDCNFCRELVYNQENQSWESDNNCIQDCNGDWGGTALENNCETCVGGLTGLDTEPICDFCDEKLNGIFDEGEYFFDSNENGIWDNGEDFTDTTNGQWDDWEIYMDANRSGSFDEGELFRDEPNGTWDEGEEWIDNININDKYDPPEPLSDGSQWKDNCGICIHSDVLGDNNEQPNSTCSKDCSPTRDDCVSPGIWQLDLDYKRQHPELDSLEFPIDKQGCWNGPKVPDSSFNAENPHPDNCCYPYLYTEQVDTNRYQLDCKNNCGGSAWEDYCGECVDTTQTNAIWNDTSIETCAIIAEANTINECVGDSADYKLWGRWDEANKICYCPLSAGIVYDPTDFISTITTTSEVGNFVNNCGLCVKIGSGNTNVGGCD